jgi:hypothetical protein
LTPLNNRDCNIGHVNISQNIENYIPESLLGTRKKEDWIKDLMGYHSKLVGKNKLQTRLLFIEALKQFPTYGITLFDVKVCPRY